MHNSDGKLERAEFPPTMYPFVTTRFRQYSIAQPAKQFPDSQGVGVHGLPLCLLQVVVTEVPKLCP